ncbi:hypothetical protein F383_16578 [Gossypium arboreum]|uniref:Uncharacterized protein n=1 Tax=Gossypium arboreum TaxID=29729 RepID=A0A0B0NQG1_GOSAR|nr:hypothetical protein F383_16578 [Gossypium arboreum]
MLVLQKKYLTRTGNPLISI